MNTKPTMTPAELAAWEVACEKGELYEPRRLCQHDQAWTACNDCRFAYHAAYKRGRKAERRAEGGGAIVCWVCLMRPAERPKRHDCSEHPLCVYERCRESHRGCKAPTFAAKEASWQASVDAWKAGAR